MGEATKSKMRAVATVGKRSISRMALGRPVLASALASSQGPVHRRSIIHLPILGAMGAKVIGLLALKKTAVVTIVSKVGVGRTVEKFREVNTSCLKQGIYNQGTHDYVSNGIVQLESSLKGVRDSEAAQHVWTWVKNLEGKAPGFGQAFAKSFVERQSAYKWARALMEESTPGKAEELKSSVSVVGESLDPAELEQLRE